MKKSSLMAIAIISGLLFSGLAVSSQASNRTFTGSGTVNVINPTHTRLAICTPNEKYSFEPGNNYSIRLYVRNDMDNKTVRMVHTFADSDPRISFIFNPETIEEIPPTEYSYYDIQVMIPADMPVGDYRVDFLTGTDEFFEGSFQDEILIRVRGYSDVMHIILAAVSVVILAVFIFRFALFRRINRKRSLKISHNRISSKRSLKLRP
jgi:uncharacterized membrane protein